MAVLRQQTQVFNKPIGVVRANAGGAQVAQAISAAADTISKIGFTEAAENAERKGIEVAQALEESQLKTMNPETGKPEAFKAPKGFGKIAATAYQRVVDSRFEDSVEAELRTKAQEIALNHQYNPESYDDVFSDYIGNMSKTAQGKYKVFIQTAGARYLESTKLNIRERTITQARQQLSERLSTGLSTKVDEARALAAAGGFVPREGQDVSDAQELGQKAVQDASDGEQAYLLKGGSSVSTSNDVNFGIAKGAIEYIIENTASPAERVAVNLAIRTNGKTGMELLPAATRDRITALLPYVSVGTEDQLLQYSSSVATVYNNQWEIEKDRAEAVAAQAAIKEDLIGYNIPSSLGQLASGQAYSLFAPEYDDFGRPTGARVSPSPAQIAGSVAHLSKAYNLELNRLTARRQSDSISQPEFDSATKDAREAILHDLIVPAAALSPKSVDSLKFALTNPNDPNSYKGLTQVQVGLVHEILGSDFYKKTDNDFIQSTLNGIKNTAAISDSEMLGNYQLTQAVNLAGAMASSGSLLEEDYQDIIKRIEARIGSYGYTDVQAIEHRSKLNTQVAIGYASTFGGLRGMNSRTMNQLQMYVDLKGQVEEPSSVPSQVAEYGNKILSMVTTATELDAVVGKISGIKSTLTTAETKDKAAKEISALRNSISGGSADKSDLKTRETVDGMLYQEGLDLSNFNSFSNEDKQVALHYIRNGGSEVLGAALNNMADGQQVRGAESFIALYALLSTDMVPGRNEPTNQLEPYFNDDVSNALLKDAFNVYKIRGGNEGIDTIINELAAKRADPKAIANMNIILGTKGGASNRRQETPLSFAGEITGNDPSIYPELASVVEYFALTGLNKKQIKTRVEAIIDQKYPKSLNIIDTSMPIGSVTRSRKAVVKLIPDDDIRQSFYDRHNDRLAKLSKDMGMELRINDGTQASIDDVGLARPIVAAGISMAASAMGLTERVEDANVYLRPDPSGASDRYYFYYKDENNELQPLSYPADSKGNYLSEEDGGTSFWYSATPDETIGDLVAAKLSKTKASLEQSADANAVDQELRVNWLTQSSPAASADFMMQRLIKGFPEATRPSESK
tara:strand:+ start:634 stop:3885 length:3252 start_codon:yes stop_codon:yes gene_type:complete